MVAEGLFDSPAIRHEYQLIFIVSWSLANRNIQPKQANPCLMQRKLVKTAQFVDDGPEDNLFKHFSTPRVGHDLLD